MIHKIPSLNFLIYERPANQLNSNPIQSLTTRYKITNRILKKRRRDLVAESDTKTEKDLRADIITHRGIDVDRIEYRGASRGEESVG